ncbi:hypothetical protein EJ05DRAFT_305570 [Pseudovirgaria hyperparasitica]|uniref:Clr5 domain-containing protein n=1 Tax=Pseudovirgaria hyperparasitica TaxID=470096 RepID=A0A6A6W9V2_9PEZI|nr:uncharacterized protein EJ05DRAFT_305570 [Pseudovirgaria hyperparasitica]KAF2759648.1 hypothetical protein EJ05DRAFT_305570 [Pseudovirgaria hyperparasitica]
MVEAPIHIKTEEPKMDFWIHHHNQFNIHMFDRQSQPRQTLHQRDWNSHRAEIEQLYAQQELRTVMTYMEDTYAFHATEKQWKSQLRKWGMKKRTGGSDYKAMLKKRRERERERPGIRTEFFLRGELISQAKIDRYESEARKKGKITKDDMFEEVRRNPSISNVQNASNQPKHVRIS